MGGLIGSDIAGAKAGKTADLFFNVVAYTQEGKKTTIAFRFVNPKPANQPKMELPMFTGLAMGKTRWLDELRAALAAPTGQTGNPSLPDQINGQCPVSIRLMAGVNLVDRLAQFFRCLLIPENAVGIRIVTRAVATRQSSWHPGVNLAAGGGNFRVAAWAPLLCSGGDLHRDGPDARVN